MTKNDSLVLLSTSGTSANITAALGCILGREDIPNVLLITGEKFLATELNKVPTTVFDRIVIASKVVSTIQEATLFVIHRIASAIEKRVVLA